MTNVPRPPARRQRKPLLPVNVTATLTGSANPADLPDELACGVAILTIISGDETDPDTRVYWCRFVFADCEPYAVELIRFGSRERYRITLSDERCDCPDATYRGNRPGGCKHVNALRQVLPALADTLADAVRKAVQS
jgi:hypothetical protein